MKLKQIIVALFAFATSLTLFAGTPFLQVTKSKGWKGQTTLARIEGTTAKQHAKILALFEEAKSGFPEDRRNLYGPDAGYIELLISDGADEIRVRSWHPLYAENKKTIVTSEGVSALGDRDPKEVLANDAAWYRHARATFDKIHAFALATDAAEHARIHGTEDLQKAVDLALTKVEAYFTLANRLQPWDKYRITQVQHLYHKTPEVWLVTFKPTPKPNPTNQPTPVMVGGELFVTVDLASGETTLRFGE